MYLTENQEYLLSVLAETHFLRCTQAHLLLRLREPWKTQAHTDTALRQLRYLGRTVFCDDNVVALAQYRNEMPDLVMLNAVDIMLDLAGREILQISARKFPYKLCFLALQNDGNVGSFAIIPVDRGQSAVVSAQVRLIEQERRTVVFMLSDWHEHEGINIGQPHYFAHTENGKRRYFKGVVAGN